MIQQGLQFAAFLGEGRFPGECGGEGSGGLDRLAERQERAPLESVDLIIARIEDFSLIGQLQRLRRVALFESALAIRQKMLGLLKIGKFLQTRGPDR